MRSHNAVYLDAGHGGINPSTGKYTTAPSKMFQFKTGEFHDKGWFYEGVKNKTYINALKPKLEAKGIKWYDMNHEWMDTSLTTRTNLANSFYDYGVQKNNPNYKGFYLSEHSNASVEHSAVGFSVWTSPGVTKSDELAELLFQMYAESFKPFIDSRKIKMLADRSDGDNDWEAKFHVLTQTKMPAVLIENLFFDHIADATLLMTEAYKDAYTTILADWIDKCLDILSNAKKIS